jgi:hypothetical protein
MEVQMTLFDELIIIRHTCRCWRFRVEGKISADGADGGVCVGWVFDFVVHSDPGADCVIMAKPIRNEPILIVWSRLIIRHQFALENRAAMLTMTADAALGR